MKIRTVCAESFSANTYLLISGCHALVVDPAVSINAILEAAREEDAFVDGILLTHGHFDHVFSLDGLRTASGVEAYIHEEDAVMLTDGKKNAFYDFFGKERTYAPAERQLLDGERIRLGNEEITVLHTPGHTRGSTCYLCGEILITGDTLFSEGFGRCDLWGGDMEQMRASLSRLSALDKSITIYPGHGCSARLGDALDSVAYLL